jgi:hypothetical protein
MDAEEAAAHGRDGCILDAAGEGACILRLSPRARARRIVTPWRDATGCSRRASAEPFRLFSAHGACMIADHGWRGVEWET